MGTWNKDLHALSREDVDRISTEFLMGWCDLIGKGYSFRIKGFNHMREKFGLEPLTREMSLDYRIKYVQTNYTYEEIYNIISEYLKTARVGSARWTGIELFNCRFGREYAKAFKMLLGSHAYRKLAEDLRNKKSIETQTELYGGIGLAGDATMQKAVQTNLKRHGGTNVMHDKDVRDRLVETNTALYGGMSPFNSPDVRLKAKRVLQPELIAAMKLYKTTHKCDNLNCESMPEFIAFRTLVDRFGADDVFCQYGLHPYDARYPYNCDLYIKSLDLFIELHLYYVHGTHWYDPNDHDDNLRLKHLKESGKLRNEKAAKIWSIEDVEKRKKAASSQIRYLVFWYKNQNKHGLAEFEKWFFEYNCDYDKFVRDYPCNTY